MTEQERTVSALEALELIEANLERLVWPCKIYPDECHYLRVVAAALDEREALVEACEALIAAGKVLSEEPIPFAIIQAIEQARDALALVKERQPEYNAAAVFRAMALGFPDV